MSDVAIGPASIPNFNPTVKTTPIYLVAWETPIGKSKCSYMLATRHDDAGRCAKFVGIKYDSSSMNEETLTKEYDSLLKSADKIQYKEFLIPYNRIIYINNLIYRHK